MAIHFFRSQALVGKIDPDVRSTGKTQDMKEYVVQKIILWMYALLTIGACLLPLEGRAQTTVKYIHTDALGSVVAMTGSTGAVIETTRENEPYGLQLTPAIQDGLGYTGHVQDAATGLTYMQQRYYDPQLGMFLSVDPVTAYDQPLAAFNRYRYANSNPYKFTDPDGRDPHPIIDDLFPKGDIFRTTGEAFGALAAYAEGVLTGNEDLKNAALDGMRENVTTDDGFGAAMMGVGPRGGKGSTGYYTNTHKSGMRYHGKGSEARMNRSGTEKANANNDPVVDSTHNPTTTSREAFKGEARAIEADGGPGNGNYNKINSPGKKYLEQDGD